MSHSLTVLDATYRLLRAQGRMLDDWAETAPESMERLDLWQNLHTAGEQLRDALEVVGKWPM